VRSLAVSCLVRNQSKRTYEEGDAACKKPMFTHVIIESLNHCNLRYVVIIFNVIKVYLLEENVFNRFLLYFH